MGICYFVINTETKERFYLGKFWVTPFVDWTQLDTNPEACAFDIHKQWLEGGNKNFEYAWCLALVRYMRSCFTSLKPLIVSSDTNDDYWTECRDVGSRHDSFEGQAV